MFCDGQHLASPKVENHLMMEQVRVGLMEAVNGAIRMLWDSTLLALSTEGQEDVGRLEGVSKPLL